MKLGIAISMAAVLLVGCGNGPNNETRPKTMEEPIYSQNFKVTVDDRLVQCVVAGTGSWSGISCDWNQGASE